MILFVLFKLFYLPLYLFRINIMIYYQDVLICATAPLYYFSISRLLEKRALYSCMIWGSLKIIFKLKSCVKLCPIHVKIWTLNIKGRLRKILVWHFSVFTGRFGSLVLDPLEDPLKYPSKSFLFWMSSWVSSWMQRSMGHG